MPTYYGADGKAYPDFQSAQATYTGVSAPTPMGASPYQNKTREDIAGYIGIALNLVDGLVGLPGMNQQRDLERQRLEVVAAQQRLAQSPGAAQPSASVGADQGTPWLLIGGVAGGAVVLSIILVKVLD